MPRSDLDAPAAAPSSRLRHLIISFPTRRKPQSSLHLTRGDEPRRERRALITHHIRVAVCLCGFHQAVVANAARTKAEGTDRWADLLKSTMSEGLVRDAILASPAWPDIAAGA